MDDNKVGVERFKVQVPVKASPQAYQKAVETLSEGSQSVTVEMTPPDKGDIKKEKKPWEKKKSAIRR